MVVALDGGERVGEDVLGDGGSSADVGVAADAAVLVHRAERADDGVVLHRDVAGERGGVGEDAAVADVGVVADVHVGHDEAAGADRGDAAAANGSAGDGDVLADGGVGADGAAGGLAEYFRSWGATPRQANGWTVAPGPRVRWPSRTTCEMRLAVLAEDDVGADGAPRADGAGCGDLRASSDDGGGMDVGGAAHSFDSPRLETGGAAGFLACGW